MFTHNEQLLMAALLSWDWSAQTLVWLDSHRLLWPVPARAVAVFHEIGPRRDYARGGMSEAACAEVVLDHSLAILVGLAGLAGEHQCPLTTFGHVTPGGQFSIGSLRVRGAAGRGHRRHNGDLVVTDLGMPLCRT